MDTVQYIVATISLTMGVAWASGVNLYAAVLTLGLLGATGYAELPSGLQILSDPIVLTVAGVLFVVEFFADKVPGVDTGWDVIQTFIRIPAGAVLAAGAVSELNPAIVVAAGLAGAGMATAAHTTKAGTRVAINASPEPFSNWVASFSEDIAVIGGVWAALQHPWIFLLLLIAFLAFSIWFIPKLWRGIRAALSRILSFFKSKQSTKEIPSSSSSLSHEDSAET